MQFECQNRCTENILATVDRHSKISCITLQETWCDESNDMTKFVLPGYTMITKFKRTEDSNHDGYVHDDFSFGEVEGNQSLVHETFGIALWRKDVNITNKYVIFCVYRVPTGLTPDLLLFIDKFTELLERFQNKKAYFCCDTNINLLEIVNKTHFNTFYENITPSGYLPQITLPTRLGSNTLIDNIFTNNIHRSHTNCILQHKLSDHQAMMCILKMVLQ